MGWVGLQGVWLQRVGGGKVWYWWSRGGGGGGPWPWYARWGGGNKWSTHFKLDSLTELRSIVCGGILVVSIFGCTIYIIFIWVKRKLFLLKVRVFWSMKFPKSHEIFVDIKIFYLKQDNIVSLICIEYQFMCIIILIVLLKINYLEHYSLIHIRPNGGSTFSSIKYFKHCHVIGLDWHTCILKCF